MGLPDSPLVQGALRSARAHGLAHDYLTPAEVAARFPGFRLTDDLVAVREANAGILEQEACIAAHLELAASHGAELHHTEPVLRWLADGAGVRVETARGSYTAEQLVVTAGPWAGEVLADLALPLTNWRVVSVQVRVDPCGVVSGRALSPVLLGRPGGDLRRLPLASGSGAENWPARYGRGRHPAQRAPGGR
jgi:glycine/D-amino acid oxidase-like deaminating enzyme